MADSLVSSEVSHLIATLVERFRAYLACTFRLPVGLGILSRNPRTAATHVPYDVLQETFYDSPAPVRQRYLAGADAKGSYVASRLIGLGCSIRCSRAGFAHRPRFSPLLFSAKPERNAFNAVGFRHVWFTSRIIPIFIRLGRLLRGRPACSLLMK